MSNFGGKGVALVPTLTRIAYGSITSSYAQLCVVPFSARIMQVFNTLGSTSDIGLSLGTPGVLSTTDVWRLEGESFILELRAGNITPLANMVLGIKYYTQPTAGTLRVVFL